MPIAEIADILLETAISLYPESLSLNASDLPTCARRRKRRLVCTRKVRILSCILAALLIIYASYFALKRQPMQGESRVLVTNKISEQDGFAGCLILKDDNDRLAEWIAYHWLVLPLKYLVVGVDPNGKTSPHEIVSLFNDTKYNLGMEIMLWNDVDYGHWVDEEMDDVHKHRDRQKRFLYKCQKYHKRKGRSWLAFIDPDEYITFNILSDDDRDPQRKDDAYMFEGMDEKMFDTDYRIETHKAREKMTKENILFQKTVFEYINEHKDETPWREEYCYLMPRTQFSSIESPNDILQDAGVSQYGLNPRDFSTLRYFKHGEKGTWNDNRFGKVILDLSRTEMKQIRYPMDNVHAPIRACPYPFRFYESGLLRVHHYLGSWEQYSFRSDVRRNRDKFDNFAYVNYGSDYQLQSWLKRFVDMVGVENSKELLKSAGVLDNNSKSLPPLKEQPDYGYIEVQPPKMKTVVKEEMKKETPKEGEVFLDYYYENEKLVKVVDTKTGKEISLDDPSLNVNTKNKK